jgi:hypothetical protein
MTRWASASRLGGKITLAAGEVICFHFMDGGLPPNLWPLAARKKMVKTNKHMGNRILTSDSF